MYISARGYRDDKQEICDANSMTWIQLARFPDEFTIDVGVPGEPVCLEQNRARD
jgi:hypothetical protein